jgi:putative transposase
LTSVYATVLQDVLKRLDKNFSSFYLRIGKGIKSGFPRFKGQNRYNSFTYQQVYRIAIKFDGNKLYLPKIGKIKIKLSRSMQGKLKTCTVIREANKWFVSFVAETFAVSLPKTGKQIGIDVGIKHFAILSDGTKIENSKFYESQKRALRIAERRIARRKKGSNRRRKAVLQLGKIYRKTVNQRRDFHHKFSTQLVKHFDLIAIENLNVEGMAKGICSKQVYDVAWSYFFNMLRYKAENADKKLIEVNPSGTSQTCICGERVEKLITQRTHFCSNCGLSEHRDVVSAKVILQRAVGQTVKAIT